MKNKLVTIPAIKTLIHPSPGFAKKELSEFKIDLLGLCGFGCRYCSSNNGNYLRIFRQKFADLTEAQLGERVLPNADPSLMFVFDGVVDLLARELQSRGQSWGAGKTLVFSMLTDSFSPWLVGQGITRSALELLLERTSFRIRVLTKNAVVGTDEWIQFFRKHPGRFVVGLSCGTLDDDWARKIELGTSSPTARLRAIRRLQHAGVPTYGMLCPIFPDVLELGRLDELIDKIDPAACEHVWAEPFNDRQNWKIVRQGYALGSAGWDWMTRCFEHRESGVWSRYATDLYARLRRRAEADGWLPKLRFLLYEHHVNDSDAQAYGDLRGVLLQSTTDDGRSKHPAFRGLQSPSK